MCYFNKLSNCPFNYSYLHNNHIFNQCGLRVSLKNCIYGVSLFKFFECHILGVFALAICLMVLQIPETKKHNSENPHYIPVYIPKHDDVYAPIGTVIEVRNI